MAQLMFRIANEAAPDILTVNPSLPQAFVAFLDKAMAKNAEERYQTGEEFAAALRATLAGSGSAAATGDGVDLSL
jgi:serine/threonine-protein kinase